ncbi:hypothetical protein [Deinococcus aquaedulcis]|uniref:hypothetical protein n=1 Tax=Deinococcus aquaedulcis TaxID=2840455 RepID=UPI001C838C9C|nr:hypothetical protein [Deinococcus aquaedulcis]
MSQGPKGSKRPDERRPDERAPSPTPRPQEDPLLPDLGPGLGIVEPGLDEEGILIDIMCKG